MFVVGMVELGRVIMVHQVLVNAAREGARRGIVPQATDAEVLAIVDGYMASAGIQGHTRQISPSLAAAASHQPLSVTVSVPHSQVSWGFAWIFAGDTTYSETVTMRRE